MNAALIERQELIARANAFIKKCAIDAQAHYCLMVYPGVYGEPLQPQYDIVASRSRPEARVM